jgi:hypothetical protein
MNAETPCLVVAGGDHAALIRTSADRERPAAQGGVVAHFDRGVKAVAIAMNDFSDGRGQGGRGGNAVRGKEVGTSILTVCNASHSTIATMARRLKYSHCRNYIPRACI